MKAKIIGGLLLSSALLFPIASIAAAYEYVNTNGNLETVVANDPSQALVTAPDIAPTSGVMLTSDPPATISSDPTAYDYVNTSGSLESEVASSPIQALEQPTDKAPTSGVILQADMSL